MPTEYIIDLKTKNIKGLIKKIKRIIIENKELHILDEYSYHFQPYGDTYFFVLSESHFIIHTYPENQLVNINIFSCADKEPKNTIKKLIEELNPTETRFREIRRNIKL